MPTTSNLMQVGELSALQKYELSSRTFTKTYLKAISTCLHKRLPAARASNSRNSVSEQAPGDLAALLKPCNTSAATNDCSSNHLSHPSTRRNEPLWIDASVQQPTATDSDSDPDALKKAHGVVSLQDAYARRFEDRSPSSFANFRRAKRLVANVARKTADRTAGVCICMRAHIQNNAESVLKQHHTQIGETILYVNCPLLNT
jgi:hypothetical protein